MSFRWFYERVAGDVRDPENEFGKHRGIVVSIGERDGGIVIGTLPVEEYDKKDAFPQYAIVNTDEAEEIIAALRDAIRHAGKQPDGTPWQPKLVRDR